MNKGPRPYFVCKLCGKRVGKIVRMISNHLEKEHGGEMVSMISLRGRPGLASLWPADYDPGRLCWFIDGKLYRYNDTFRMEPA